MARHRGRIFKVTGDGVLVEFGSAVNALQCAVGLQQEMAAANTDLPEARRIVLRIGVNLGDVMVEGSDLYGDGVNIAARLESVAEPGGILVSGTTYDFIKNKVDVGFDDLGAQTLKNIAEVVRVYRVAGTPRVSVTIPKTAADKPSVAVLPFTNMSGDPDQQYFSDGITEDIITELSRFRQLHALARNSSFRYRGKSVDVVRVGRKLGVQYVVEGSVRRLGDRIRITAQLIDAASGNHLWSERFDHGQDDIFVVQDEVVQTIVSTLVGRVHAAGFERAKRKPPASLAAYEYLLRGAALPIDDPNAETEARRLYERAIELDPEYARAYISLAYSYGLEWYRDMTDSDSALDRAFELARKAVVLDENDSASQAVLGWAHRLRHSYGLAEHHYLKAIELNRNSPALTASLGSLYACLGRLEDGLSCYKKAKLMDPFFEPTWYWAQLGIIHFMAGRYDEAITDLGRSPTMAFWVQAYLAASYALTDRIDRAKRHVADVLRLSPHFSVTRFVRKEVLEQSAYRERLIDGLRQAGLPE